MIKHDGKEYTKLNLACGPKVENKFPLPWLNVDVEGPAADIHMNITDLPAFWTNQFDEVRASHVLEHFFMEEVPTVLAEWARVVKPGGRLRIIVPDLDVVLANLQEGVDSKGRPALSVEQTTPVLVQLYGLGYEKRDMNPFWRHRIIFNRGMLTELFQRTGEATLIEVRDKESDPAHELGIRDDSQNDFSLHMVMYKRTQQSLTHE